MGKLSPTVQPHKIQCTERDTKRRFVGAFCLAAAAALSTNGFATDNPLLATDLARGCDAPGLSYEIQLDTLAGAAPGVPHQHRRYLVESRQNDVIVTWLNPPESAQGFVVLMNGRVARNFGGHSLTPIIVAVSDRVTGLAAVGDIIATCFARDYQIAALGKGAAAANELRLTPQSPLSTYNDVRLWLDPKTKLARKLELSLEANKPTKIATITYGPLIKVGDKQVPFIKKLELQQLDNGKAVEVVTWNTPVAHTFKADYFTVEALAARLADLWGLPK